MDARPSMTPYTCEEIMDIYSRVCQTEFVTNSLVTIVTDELFPNPLPYSLQTVYNEIESIIYI